MSDALRINNNLYSWGSLSFKIDGVPYTGIASVKYAHKRERAKGYGMGQHQAPRGRTRGKYTTEAITIKMFRDSAEALRAQLAASSPSGNSYGEHEFPVVIQAYEPPQDPITVQFLRCVYEGSTTDAEEGVEPGMEEITLDCFKIVENGRVLFDDSAGAP